MRAIWLILGAAIVAAPACADDSSAALGAGGVVLTHGTPVRMAAEDLFISPKQVRVHFVFANDTDKDIDTVVAFPLPDIDTATYWGSAVGTVTDDPANFIGFRLSVDGKPVAFKIEQRAFLKEKDVTAEIKAVGAPLNPVAGHGYLDLDKLPAAMRKHLIALGIAEGDGDQFVPQWVLRTKFYWQQRFPAHKSVVIDHSYQPVTGQSLFGSYSLTDKEELARNRRDFCLDAGTEAAIRLKVGKLDPKSESGAYLQAFETDYVLKTANNWKGPIGHFHLTLDKLKPANVLSLCWDGELRKTGATTFESTRSSFAPARDISLLVLQ